MSKHLDWSKITPDIAIWCQTEEEDIAFRRECEERGIRWQSGNNAKEISYFGGQWYMAVEHDVLKMVEVNENITPYSSLLIEDKPTRSRLAEILGVEEDEEWEYRGTIYRVKCNKRQYESGGDWFDCGAEFELCHLIDNPSLIIRKPRFSEDELAMLRCFAAAGIREVSMDQNNRLWTKNKDNESWLWPHGLLATILPGQCVEIAEVLK